MAPIGENLIRSSFAHLLCSNIFFSGWSWKSIAPHIYLKGNSAYVVGEIEDKCVSLFTSLCLMDSSSIASVRMTWVTLMEVYNTDPPKGGLLIFDKPNERSSLRSNK